MGRWGMIDLFPPFYCIVLYTTRGMKAQFIWRPMNGIVFNRDPATHPKTQHMIKFTIYLHGVTIKEQDWKRRRNKIGPGKEEVYRGRRDNIHTRIHTHYTTSLIMYAAWFCSPFQGQKSAYDDLHASPFFNALDIFPPGVRTGQFWSRRGEKLGREKWSIFWYFGKFYS